MMCHPNAPLEFQQHPMPGRNAQPDDRAVRISNPWNSLQGLTLIRAR